jgi:NADH-quinone oxidoreductase subunit G
VDLCPVGALLDKDFLFKQRVWLLKETASISPADAGGENIWLHHNEGIIYRIKPRYNAEVNTWWISDDTRYSFKPVHDTKRPHRRAQDAIRRADPDELHRRDAARRRGTEAHPQRRRRRQPLRACSRP